jgi:hypothetical protein
MKLGQTSLFMESMKYDERSNLRGGPPWAWGRMGTTPWPAAPIGGGFQVRTPFLGWFGKRGEGVPTRTRTPPRFGKGGKERVGTQTLPLVCLGQGPAILGPGCPYKGHEGGLGNSKPQLPPPSPPCPKP